MSDKDRVNVKAQSTATRKDVFAVNQDLGQAQSEVAAQAILEPAVQAAATVACYSTDFGKLNLSALIGNLNGETKQMSAGSLEHVEALLMSQAQTLDAIFHKLARKASFVDYVNQFDMSLRLAFKAQNQCRATLATLAEMKNPRPIAFVKQTNVATNQQVNNGALESLDPPRPREVVNRPNELLEQKHDQQWLDVSAAGTASSVDPQLEAVGTVYRSRNAKG